MNRPIKFNRHRGSTKEITKILIPEEGVIFTANLMAVITLEKSPHRIVRKGYFMANLSGCQVSQFVSLEGNTVAHAGRIDLRLNPTIDKYRYIASE